MRDELARASSQFEHEFGAAPRIRGSLHFGPVIIGEIGDVKRAIVFNGDVMNTAARLEELSRTATSMAAFWRRARRWNALAPCRRSWFAILAGCRSAVAPTASTWSASTRRRWLDPAPSPAWSAQLAGFSVTRNPSRGFGIGHICQAGV
jgi:hypothetical protein